MEQKLLTITRLLVDTINLPLAMNAIQRRAFRSMLISSVCDTDGERLPILRTTNDKARRIPIKFPLLFNHEYASPEAYDAAEALMETVHRIAPGHWFEIRCDEARYIAPASAESKGDDYEFLVSRYF